MLYVIELTSKHLHVNNLNPGIHVHVIEADEIRALTSLLCAGPCKASV